MLTRYQLVVMSLVAIVSGSIGALLMCFILSGEYLFAGFVVVVISCLFAHEFIVEQKCEEEKEDGFIFFPADFVYNPSSSTRRCGDVHVGGEVMPEFNGQLNNDFQKG